MTTTKPATMVKVTAFALGMLATSAIAQIAQDDGANYVAFEAEGSVTLVPGTPENWVIATDSGANGGRALMADGTTSTGDSPHSFAQYPIRFKTAGTYYLYYRWRADAARTASDTQTANSSWVGNRLGAFSTPGAAAQADYVRTDSNNYFAPDNNTYHWLREVLTLTYTVGAAQTASVQTLTFGTREAGMLIDRVVLSTDSALTSAALDALPNSGAAAGGLRHRYSFNDATTSTNAVDSVGGATGSLYPGATYPGDGTVSLDGASGFVWLPDDIVSNYTSSTFEIWTTPTANPNWARLFDFGTTTGGKGHGGAGDSSTGTSWFYLCLSDGVSSSFRADINPPGAVLTGPQPTPGKYHHLVFTIDATARTAALYDNGVMVAYNNSFTAAARDVGHTYNDYIGRSQWPDPYYVGSIDEFRIYNGSLSPVQVEANYEAGANTAGAAPGALNSIQLNVPASLVVGAVVTPSVRANYAALTNSVNITTMAGITYASDNTNVVVFAADGNFRASSPGTATLQAAYGGKTSSVTVTVTAEAAVLKHRYSFNGAVGATAISDSVGGAHGTLINGSDTATLGGGKLVLDGNFSSAYVELPAGIISKLTNATFQSWVTWDGGNAWQRIWDFGTNSGVGQNVSAAYLSPYGGDFGAMLFGFNMAGEQRVNASSRLVRSNEVCVTVSYSYSGQTASIYVGGRKVASGTVNKALFNLPDVYNWLGRAKYNDPYYAGSFNEFRIYSGAESDLQVAISAAAGPESTLTDPGALASLTVTAPQTSFEAQSLGGPLQVLATFANVSNVEVTTLAETTIRSSDPSVAKVVNGNIVPMGVGTTVISASYGGKSGSLSVTVTDSSPWPTLLHRYSFADAQGTTIADSVGSINGTFHGVGNFTGSQLVLPAGNPAPLGDGNPNPNSGWISFPAGQGIVSGLPSQASFECWVVWNGGAVWQEIFDFGQAGTPGLSLGGGKYMMVCPYDGVSGALRAEWWPGGLVLTGPRVPQGVLSQIVLTHDQDRQFDKLYLNGQLVASGVNTWLFSDMPDVDNWLARDQWPDAFFNGSFDEFRIWQGALTAGQVANLYAAGPSTVPGPDLKISRSGNQITVKWTANATSFGLQTAPDLKAGAWVGVPGTPVVVDGMNNLTLPIGQQPAYFRLKQ